MKFLIIIFLVFITIVFAGNYIDYRRGRITRREFEARMRLSILLIVVVIFLALWLRKR